ncbi:MAG: hypothetical protein JXA60_05260 [Candidatus Coatesbacteria bacterium]|nr:hypothetical protein [Candidatus Coatesbacteria bacterium]
MFKHKANIDLDKVPLHLQDLIPFLQRWNIRDDITKDKFISESSDTEKELFLTTIENRKEQIRKWIDSLQKDNLNYETRLFIMLLKTYNDLKSKYFEYSVNLDIQDLEKIINIISKILHGRFSNDEIENFINTCRNLKVDEEAVFSYEISYSNQDSSLTILVAMDDVDSPDLYIYIDNLGLLKKVKDSVNS